jgi:uncharacterized DUF497 family protein
VPGGIEFDWDDENKKHLNAHNVSPAEFEQLLNNNPIDLNFELIDSDERHRSVGLTKAGRFLSVVWTIRNGKVRAITAIPASVSDRKAFLEKPNEEAVKETTQARHTGFRQRGGRGGVVV